jgi:ATP-binding cassette subfamily B protein
LWRWYVGATLAVLLTNWMAVQVPMQMADGLDALRAGEPAGRYAAVIALLGASVIVVRTLSRIWFFTPARIAEFNLREDLFGHMLRLQPSFYAAHPTGDLVSRATSDVTYARAFAGFALLQAVNVVGSLIIGVGQMLALSPLLTAACLAPVLVAFAIVQYAANRLILLQRRSQALLGQLSDDILGTLQGVATVQAFCVEGPFAGRLEGRSGELRATNLRMARLRALTFPLLGVAGGVSVYFLLALGGDMAVRNTITPGELAAFLALVVYVLLPLRVVGWLIPVFQRSAASLERIHEILDAPVDRPEGDAPAPMGSGGPRIEVRGLDLPPILHDLSVDIPAGSTVGVYGATGSGKTTLLRVLARLRNPPPGTVFVDGIDVTRVDLAAWRRRLTLVPQAPFLFSETIRENIGFGASDAEVRAAAEAAALGPDLQALPDGIDTVVGERGISLSGGQRQRVALARGLARRADVVLLDDVLSAVDHHTEQELLTTLRARKGATRIVVSHRLSALEQADSVIVMEGGRVVDQGTHADLLERAGPYRDAWEAQRA